MIIILILQFLTSTPMKVLKSRNYAHAMISTTSIQQTQPNKIDSIIGRLENRKIQLLHFLSHKQKHITINQPSSRTTNSHAHIDCAILERRKKYEQKVYEQMQAKNKIKKQVERLEQNLIQVVVQLQNNEIQLKAISKQSFGIDYQGCQNSMKWVYHRILHLQQTIQNQQLKLREILCQFFHQQNFHLKTDYRQMPSNYCFLHYIAANRLVNKLYGVILNKKSYKSNTQVHQTKQEQDQDEQSLQVCRDNSQGQENAEESRTYAQVNDHDIWLQILKLMKKLQKMQNLDSKGQIKSQQVLEQINEMINESRRIKSHSRKLKEKIKNIRQHKQELEEQINIKHQLIEGIVHKINKLDINIEKSVSDQLQNQNQNSIQENPEKAIEVTRKQLKQIQEAIRYFSIKKSTKDIITKDTIKATLLSTEKQLKAIDSTSTLLSPHKSTLTIVSNRYLSPDLKQTRKNSQSKYSLKDLLTPPKQLTTIQKRQAWK